MSHTTLKKKSKKNHQKLIDSYQFKYVMSIYLSKLSFRDKRVRKCIEENKNKNPYL